MTSTDIETQVADLVSVDRVVERMFWTASVFEHGAANHAKRASYSACTCMYCATIKQYVSAKIRAKRIDRDMPPYDEQYASLYNLAMERRGKAQALLAAATVAKNQVAAPMLSMVSLLPS